MKRVAPARATSGAASESPSAPTRLRLLVRMACVYNWAIWSLLVVLLFAQFFGVIWSSVNETNALLYGRNPALGTYNIVGLNDEPYSDRAIACVKQSQSVRPVQLSQLLYEHRRSNNTSVGGIDGYRVAPRESFTMDATKVPHYVRQCNTVLRALDSMLSVCETLGYNVTRDFLRVVDSLDNDQVLPLRSALPVFIIPFWDKGVPARYVVPGHDGAACMLRGGGIFESDLATNALVSGVPRAVRELKTEELLKYRGGVWRNGWYEDPVVRMRWYSDVISSLPNSRFGLSLRRFEVLEGVKELDCTQLPYGCTGGQSQWRWSESLSQMSEMHSYESITISNGRRFGLFFFDATRTKTTTSQYSIEKLISNASLVVLLSRWMVAMVALGSVDSIGVGSLANSKSFHMLPFALLPRVKSMLEGFWTSGCNFEGNQRALSDAWFEIYPAIGELVFVYFSLLNMVAKLLRRRMSDVLFGPTLLFFGLLHYFRLELGETRWFEFDVRVAAIVTSDELESASILDFFTTDLAFRTNGRVKSIFYMKLLVLGVNLLPLLLSRRVRELKTTTSLAVENALALVFEGNGGLGSTTSPYVAVAAGEKDTERAVRPYELVRAKYVVVGASPGCVLLSIDHWFWLFAATPMRLAATLAIRVLFYDVDAEDRNKPERGREGGKISGSPRMATVADTRFEHLATRRISACAVK